MSRDLATVINDLLGVIPENQQHLSHQLEEVRDSVAFAPPEGMGLFWARAGEAIEEALGESPDLDTWHGPFLAIWTGKPLAELRTIFAGSTP